MSNFGVKGIRKAIAQTRTWSRLLDDAIAPMQDIAELEQECRETLDAVGGRHPTVRGCVDRHG